MLWKENDAKEINERFIMKETVTFGSTKNFLPSVLYLPVQVNSVEMTFCLNRLR